jgi:hypothetical protein
VYEKKPRYGVWYIELHDQYGRRHREKIGAKSLATRWCRSAALAIAEGQFLPDKSRRRDVLLSVVIKDIPGHRRRAPAKLQGLRAEREVLDRGA